MFSLLKKNKAELQDAVSKAKDAEKNSGDAVAEATAESENQTNSISKKDIATTEETKKNSLLPDKGGKHKEDETRGSTLLDLSRSAKPKPAPEENQQKAPAEQLTTKTEDKPVKKEVKKDPFFSLGVLARLGFGKKKAEEPKEELPEKEKDKEAAAEQKEDTPPKEAKVPEEGGSKTEDKDSDKKEDLPPKEGASKPKDKDSDKKDLPKAEEKESSSEDKKESPTNKEVKKDSIFGISLLSRFRSSQKKPDKKPEAANKEAEPSVETGKDEADAPKKEEAVDSNKVDDVDKSKDPEAEIQMPKEEKPKDSSEKTDFTAKDKPDTETKSGTTDKGQPDKDNQKSDASSDKKPDGNAEKPGKVEPKKDTLFSVGLLARFGFGKKKPEASEKESEKSDDKKSNEKDITPSDDAKNKPNAPVKDSDNPSVNNTEPSSDNKDDSVPSTDTVNTDVEPKEPHADKTELQGKVPEQDKLDTVVKDGDKTVNTSVPTSSDKDYPALGNNSAQVEPKPKEVGSEETRSQEKPTEKVSDKPVTAVETPAKTTESQLQGPSNSTSKDEVLHSPTPDKESKNPNSSVGQTNDLNPSNSLDAHSEHNQQPVDSSLNDSIPESVNDIPVSSPDEKSHPISTKDSPDSCENPSLPAENKSDPARQSGDSTNSAVKDSKVLTGTPIEHSELPTSGVKDKASASDSVVNSVIHPVSPSDIVLPINSAKVHPNPHDSPNKGQKGVTDCSANGVKSSDSTQIVGASAPASVANMDASTHQDSPDLSSPTSAKNDGENNPPSDPKQPSHDKESVPERHSEQKHEPDNQGYGSKPGHNANEGMDDSVGGHEAKTNNPQHSKSEKDKLDKQESASVPGDSPINNTSRKHPEDVNHGTTDPSAAEKPQSEIPHYKDIKDPKNEQMPHLHDGKNSPVPGKDSRVLSRNPTGKDSSNPHHESNPTDTTTGNKSNEIANPGQKSVDNVTSGNSKNPEADAKLGRPPQNDVTQQDDKTHTGEISANTKPHLPVGKPNGSHNMVHSQKEDYDGQSNDSETAAGVNTVVHNKKDDDSWPSDEEGLSPEEIQERREIMDEVHRLLSLDDERDLQKEAAWIRYRHKGLVELDSSVTLSDIEEVEECGDTDVDVASIDSDEMRYETFLNDHPSSGSPDLGFASPRSQYDPGSQQQPHVHGPPGNRDESAAHDSLYTASMPTSVGADLTVQPRYALQPHHPSYASKPALSDGDYDRPSSEQLDQLQLDLQRKSRSLDHIHNLDAEQSLIIQTLQENLAAVNEELDKKNKQLKMKESYLDAEHKKVQQLEREVRARDDLLSDNIAKVLNEGKLTSPLVGYKRDAPKDRLSSIDAKTRLLEYERNTAQADVKRAQESMEKIAEENTELLGRLRNMRQDLVKERATVCQLTSDKVEAEQKLRLCIEERNSSLREKQRLEQRLARHEATTMKTVQRLEGEHQRIAEDHMHKYHTLDAEGKKLALELATAQRLLEAREKEIELLKTDVEHKSQEISNLERRLTIVREEHQATREEMDNLSKQLTYKLSEEKMNQGQILEKLSSTSHQAELVKRDYDVLNANLDHERKTIRNLRDSLKMEEDKNLQLEAKLTALKHELENANRQLAENKSISDQYKKEKQVLYQDVQDLCSKLSEKDNMIAELQDKCDSTVENIHKDLTSEKSLIQQQREKLAQELSQTRQELEEAKDKLRHKDLQLQAYVHTNRHLEQETMHRQEAEKALDKAEDELLQNKRQVSQLTIENKRLMDENSHLLEMMDKLERNIAQLKDQVRQQREELMAERQELQHGHSKDLSELHSHQTDLEEKLSRAQMELKSTKSTLASALEAKDNLHAEKQNYERTVQKLKAQLSEESAAKKIADQQLQEKMSQIAELKSQKRDLDDQLANIQIQLIKSETEHKAEKDRQKKLKQDLTAAKSSSTSNEAHVQALYLRISELEGELMSLTSQAETTRQNLEGKNKRLALELKQLIETQDKERAKLIQQAQQLSADLEAARETSAEKSRENLSLQEDLMNGESKIRDLSTDLKRMSDELKNERDQRQNLEQKNHSLQMNLLKIRPQGEGDDPSSESARLEVNKMMTDLSRSMTQQLEAQKSADKESRSKDLKSFEDFKKKIAQLESSLSQEQGMHTITKTQLDAVNEDNTRLRHQLQVARKKLHGVSIEERSRSRIDDINELINRSQSRAQQMLASGMYAGANSPHSVADPLHIVTASRDFGAFSPAPVMMMTSPLSRSMMSDEILRASSPHDPGQK